MKKIVLGVLCCTVLFSAYGQGTKQDSLVAEFSKYVNREDLQKHLTILASDEYEGRETGKKGQKMAAKYIVNFFQELGLPANIGNGTYLQSFPIIIEKPGGGNVTVSNTTFSNQKDFFYLGSYGDENITIKEVVFVGYGIDDASYSDYKNVDVKGKTVVIFDGEPKDKDGRYLVSESEVPSSWTQDQFKKIKVAQEKGAANVFVVLPKYDEMFTRFKQYLLRTRTKLKSDVIEKEREVIPFLYVRPSVAEALLNTSIKKLDKSLVSASKKGGAESMLNTVTSSIQFEQNIEEGMSENVLGYLEGSDPILKKEILVISAHYDHIGKNDDVVFNGANDDGSGTVSVLELADAFKKAKDAGFGPKRSILFLLVSGEEKGLLGSKYYTDNPVFPLENTVTDLNIDMVGRVDEKHKDSGDYIYVIGSDKLSTTLHKISEEANAKSKQIEFDYTYNDPKDPNRYYYRSDHYNFAKNNIPVIFYFNGVHEDYHKETDTVEKIDFKAMETIDRVVFYTAWEIANRAERPAVDVENDFKADR